MAKPVFRSALAPLLLLCSITVGCTQETSVNANTNIFSLPAHTARIREVGEAMPGGGWNVYTNGYLGDWFETEGGKTVIRVRAAGDPADGVYPVMRLHINGKPVQSFNVDSPEYKNYEFTVDAPKGVLRVEVEFTNDSNPGSNGDRNLRIMDVSVSAAKLSPTIPVIGAESIARIRMGTLIIRTKPGTKVKVTQLRHEFPFGTCLNHDAFIARPGDDRTDEDRRKYLETARTYFNAGVHENALKWYWTEKEKDAVSYEDADRVLKWAEDNGLKLRGHCLFWAVDQYVPEWAKKLDDAALEAKMKARVQEVVSRYRGRIDEWDVNNEMLHGDYFGKRFGARINADMFKWAKAANPNAVLYMNDFAILSGPMGDAYFKQIKALQAAGAPIGGVGFQGHFNGSMDLRHVQRTLDQFATLGLPLKVTEYDMKWGNAEFQAKALTDFYRTCFAHPAIAGLTMWGFWDGSHWIQGGGMSNKDWTPKLTAKAYYDLVYNEWWTRTEATADGKGIARVRAFYGSHQIEAGSKKMTVQLRQKDGSSEVKLK